MKHADMVVWPRNEDLFAILQNIDPLRLNLHVQFANRVERSLEGRFVETFGTLAVVSEIDKRIATYCAVVPSHMQHSSGICFVDALYA